VDLHREIMASSANAQDCDPLNPKFLKLYRRATPTQKLAVVDVEPALMIRPVNRRTPIGNRYS
jgi:hypothetical protein